MLLPKGRMICAFFVLSCVYVYWPPLFLPGPRKAFGISASSPGMILLMPRQKKSAFEIGCCPFFLSERMIYHSLFPGFFQPPRPLQIAKCSFVSGLLTKKYPPRQPCISPLAKEAATIGGEFYIRMLIFGPACPKQIRCRQMKFICPGPGSNGSFPFLLPHKNALKKR